MGRHYEIFATNCQFGATVNRISSSWCQICPHWEPVCVRQALAPSGWAATRRQHIRLIWMIIPLGVGRHQYSNFVVTLGERQHLWESDAAVLFVIMSVQLQVWAHFVECTCSTNAAAGAVCKAKKNNANSDYVDAPSLLGRFLWFFSAEAERAALLNPEFGRRRRRRPETRQGWGIPDTEAGVFSWKASVLNLQPQHSCRMFVLLRKWRRNRLPGRKMPALDVGLQRSNINHSMLILIHVSLPLFFYQFDPLKSRVIALSIKS